MTLDEYFGGEKESRRLFRAVQRAIDSVAPVRMRVTKSQVAFSRRVAFAWAWMPRQYLGARGAPLVFTLGLRRRIRSRRWKKVVEPRPGRFTHHLELRTGHELDAEVRGWIHEAWDGAA